MDGSSAMAVWEPMLHQLRHIFEQVGAFRRVTVGYLSRTGGETPRIYASQGRGAPPRPAEELFDPTGRRVSVLVSDCMGSLWEGGTLRQLLQRWARQTPVAVVQPLPQRMWSRTAISIQPGRMCRKAGAYRQLEFQPRSLLQDLPALGVAIPVLSPEPAALGTWARLISGFRGVNISCAGAWLMEENTATRNDADRASGAMVDEGGEQTRELLRRFESQASPNARRLAMYLSAAALVLPVMLLVQRAMLPHSGPADLAEILSSDLLQQPDRAEEDAGEPGPWFEFAPGVRELLLQRLTLSEAALVLKHCSLYVERAFGRGARNLPAVAVAHLSGSMREPEGGSGAAPQAFARVSESVLRRFEPAIAQADRSGAGTARLERYGQRGSTPDLLRAVELLRNAGSQSRLPLARALLAAWHAWKDPAYLDEAEGAAQQALDEQRGASGDFAREGASVLADVLTERAGLQSSLGAWHPAFADLLRAEELWRECLVLPVRPGPESAAAGVGLAEVLRLQFRAEQQMNLPSGDEASGERREQLRLLEEAETQLDRLIRMWSPLEPPVETVLTLGRVLLDRVRAEQAHPVADREMAGTLETALRAVTTLRTAVDLLEGAGIEGRSMLSQTLLDLAEALILLARLPGRPSRSDDQAEGVLERAVELAREEEDERTQTEALRRLAEWDFARYIQRRDVRLLERAEVTLRDVVALQPAEDPARIEVLSVLAQVLLERYGETGAAGLIDETVKMLREVLAGSATTSSEGARQRTLFAKTLMARFDVHSRLADAYEAEWVLTQAEQLADDLVLRAQACLELGDVRTRLARRTGTTEQWEAASLAYARAADLAGRAGSPLLAARAHFRRGTVLEEIAGTEQALTAYRQAHERWSSAGAEDAAEARANRERMRALAASPEREGDESGGC
jgi:tetratricopeptide (TPR) repeat protein